MSSYLSAKFVFFLKSRLLFNIFYCFCIFVNKHFIYLAAHNSTCKYCYNAKLSADYFYVKTKISIDFQICISVPLSKLLKSQIKIKQIKKYNTHMSCCLNYHNTQLREAFWTCIGTSKILFMYNMKVLILDHGNNTWN